MEQEYLWYGGVRPRRFLQRTHDFHFSILRMPNYPIL